MRRALLAIALLLVPTLALAQAETTGRVTGTVLDEDRKPVAGADITLESPALQGQRKATSDANGRYLASLLPPGVYTMTVNAPGKSPLQYTFRVGIGQTVPIDAVLKAGTGQEETVTVFSPAATMETTAGGESFNFETKINQLPVTNRQLESVATLAPNISFGPTPGTLSISGAPSFDTVALLDGAEISDPYFGSGTVVYLEEAIEEVQVLTTGVSAKYGRFQGGVINATTKSGGNTFDGGARIDLSKQTWNSKSPFNESQSDTLTKVYSATLGGPIVKDRLWFFAGGRTIPESTTSATTISPTLNQSYSTTTEQDRWQIKLTGAISPNHVLEGSYLNYEQNTSNRAGLPAGDLRAASGKRSDPRDITTFEYQGVLTDKAFLNVQGTKKDVAIKSGGDPNLGSPILEFYTTSAFRVFGNHWWDFNDPSQRNNETASASMTNVLTTGSWGDHTLEYGIQYVNSITGGENKQSSTGYNVTNYDVFLGLPTFASCPGGVCTFNIRPYPYGLTYRWVALPGAGEQELQNLAVFLQDSWEMGKWRIDAGLRWEQWESKALVPTLDLDFDKVVPRLGVTYNITPDWQIQASYGEYVSRFNDNVASNVSGVGGAPLVQQLYTCPDALNQTYAQVDALVRDDSCWTFTVFASDVNQPSVFLRSGVEAPYAADFNMGVKRALPRNSGAFTLSYTKREFKELLESFVGDEGTVTVIDPLDPMGVATFDLDRTVWDNCALCQRDYEAVTATVNYRPSAKWDIGGNYTYAKTRGNYEGEGRNQPASGSVIGNYMRSIDQSAAFPYGYTDDDIRHRVIGYGSYRLDFGRAGNLNFGGIARYESGANWNKSAGVPAASDPAYIGEPRTYTKFFDGRGNNRFNGFWRLDTSITYRFNFWRDLGAYVKLDVLNLTNEDELLSFQTTGTTTTVNGMLVWAPSQANLAAGTCNVSGGSPVAYPNRSCRSFGRIRNELDYQLPRTISVSAGITW